MPRADPLPASDSEIGEVPSTTNPLAERGGSEGGIRSGLAAVATAILYALTGLSSSILSWWRCPSASGMPPRRDGAEGNQAL